MAMDDEMAEVVHAQLKIRRKQIEDGELTESELRSPEGETPLISLLKVMDEHLQSLIRITLSAHGDGKTKPPDIVQWPRPFTAVDAMDRQEEADDMSGLADLFGIQH